MKSSVYFFSGSGNSLHIAKSIQGVLPDTQIKSISGLDLSNPVKCDSDFVGIVFPVYFLDRPEIVRHFLERLEVKKDAYVYCVANCGAMAGNTLFNVASQLKGRGICLSAGFLMFFPDNSIVFPTAPDKISGMLSDAEKNLRSVLSDIKSRTTSENYKKSLLYGSALTAFMKFIGYKFFKFKEFNLDKDKCTKCGVCEKVCPVKNINCKNGAPEWGKSCEMCLACLHWCPSQAITMKRQKNKNGFQYTHPGIKLADFVNANSK